MHDPILFLWRCQFTIDSCEFPYLSWLTKSIASVYAIMFSLAISPGPSEVLGAGSFRCVGNLSNDEIFGGIAPTSSCSGDAALRLFSAET